MNALSFENAALVVVAIVLAGAAWIALPFFVRFFVRLVPSFHPKSRMGRLERRWVEVRTWLSSFLRYPELGGYVHDTSMSQYLPPTIFHYVVGTWTQVAGAVTDTIAFNVAAADATSIINIPVMVPSNSVANKGAYLRSVEIDYEIFTAACDAVSVLVHLVTRGADGADATVAAQTFTYDAGHDTAAERIDVDEHRMTCSLTTPVWVDNDQYVLVEFTMDRAGTTTAHMLAAVANYTLRL